MDFTAVKIPGARRLPEHPQRDGIEPMDIDAIQPAEKRACFGCKKIGHLRKNFPDKDNKKNGNRFIHQNEVVQK